MQPLELAPGDSCGIDSVAPASLSEIATVPALKELPGLEVVLDKLDQVATAAVPAPRPQTSSVASSLRAKLIGGAANRSGVSRPRSAPGSPSGRPPAAWPAPAAAPTWRTPPAAARCRRCAIRSGRRRKE